MAKICKYWWLLFAALVLVFWKRIRAFMRSPQSFVDTERQIIEKYSGQSGTTTLDDAQFLMIANQLELDLLSGMSEDETDAIKQIMKLGNKSDWAKLVGVFGLRKPFGFMRSEISLPTALARYLSASDYKIVSDYIVNMGGVI